MKAADLMIGDWVIRRGVPEEPMRLYKRRMGSKVFGVSVQAARMQRL